MERTAEEPTKDDVRSCSSRAAAAARATLRPSAAAAAVVACSDWRRDGVRASRRAYSTDASQHDLPPRLRNMTRT